MGIENYEFTKEQKLIYCDLTLKRFDEAQFDCSRSDLDAMMMRSRSDIAVLERLVDKCILVQLKNV